MRPATKEDCTVGDLQNAEIHETFDTAMICCGKSIYPEIEKSQGIVLAVWTCPICETWDTQIVGEINPEKSTGSKMYQEHVPVS
jgi:hypothetical protein